MSTISHNDFFGEVQGVVQHDQLLSLLSEFLTVERGGVQLYTLALERSRDADVRNHIRNFIEQTTRNIEVIENAIRDLGGNSANLSTGALIQQKRVEALLHLDADPELQETADIENLVLGETKCHLDWELLRAMLPYFDEAHTRNVIVRMLEQVEPQMDQGDESPMHWAKRTLITLMLRQLVRPRDQSQAA